MYPKAGLAAVLLLVSLSSQAQTDGVDAARFEAQMRRIEIALNRISMEQQSVYQQFQMLQEMQRTEMQRVFESTQSYTPPPTPPNYDDMVRERNARAQRLQRYSDEIDRLYARYRELDASKQPLLDALSELARQH